MKKSTLLTIGMTGYSFYNAYKTAQIQQRTKTGQTVLITGASSGIGKDLAYEFAKHGFNVILSSRRKDKLQEIAKDLEKYHCDAGYPLHTVIFIGTLPYECGSFGYQYDVEQKEYILINAFTLDSKTNPEYFFSTNRALSAMECLGYNYNKPKKSNYMKKAKETAANLPSYPSEGYIEESGEFVAVNLGNY